MSTNGISVQGKDGNTEMLSDLCGGTDMIRILHVMRPVSGGMACHLQSLMSGLDRELFEHILACPVELTPTHLLQAAKDVYEIAIHDGITPLRDYQAVSGLLHLLLREPFDIIHLHGYKALLIGSLALARMASIQPNHKPHVICTIHNFLSKKQKIIWKSLQYTRILKLSHIDLFVTVSEKLHSHLKDICKVGASGSPILTVQNGIAPTRHYVDARIARRVFRVTKDTFMIGTISRLNHDKGVDVLVRAMAIVQQQASDICLVVIGDGPMKKSIQKLAERLNVRNIRLLGQLPDADQYMKGFDLYIQPSRREGFGMTVIEAMRANRPVVASNVGGLSEIIEHNVSGVLVQPDNPIELAETILYLYRYPQIAELYAKAGYERMQEHYTYANMIEQWSHIYEQSYKQTSHLELSEVEMVPTH
jgi:glycosyltransferase involved in cell wall biosynthesis